MKFETFVTDSDDRVWTIQFDAATELGRYEVTDEGYLRISGVAAKAGTMGYVNDADGSTIRDYVPADVLRAASASLRNTPITLEHPPGLVTSRDVRQYQVGEVVDSVHGDDSDETEVELLVRDHEAVQAVLSREVTGLSPGYHVTREPVPEGAEFDAERVQVARRYNHLALTRRPRRGAETSVRLDSEGNAIFEPPPENTHMDPELQEALDAIRGLVTGLGSKVEELAARVPEPATDSDEDSDDDGDTNIDFLAAVKAYNSAVEAARKLGVEISVATDSTADIRRKIVAAKCGDEVAADASDGFIEGVMLGLNATPAVAPAPAADEMDAVVDAFGFNRSARPAPKADAELPSVDPTRLELNRGRAKSNTGD